MFFFFSPLNPCEWVQRWNWVNYRILFSHRSIKNGSLLAFLIPSLWQTDRHFLINTYLDSKMLIRGTRIRGDLSKSRNVKISRLYDSYYVRGSKYLVFVVFFKAYLERRYRAFAISQRTFVSNGLHFYWESQMYGTHSLTWAPNNFFGEIFPGRYFDVVQCVPKEKGSRFLY